MNSGLHTKEVADIFDFLKPMMRKSLMAFDSLKFSEGQKYLSDLDAWLNSSSNVSIACVNDEVLNDIWVLNRYIDFLSEYGKVWEKILNQQFSDSWVNLQNALDYLRSIKKFSKIDIGFFENQLIELEKLYPYNLFFSIGAVVDLFECSICGNDIDSDECFHLQGNLYGGTMASAIAKNFRSFDHVAIVSEPEDKRCVVQFDDNAGQFKLVRYLASLLASQKIKILGFNCLKFSKDIRRNNDIPKLGRNDFCFCGSGKKFKHCCILKKYKEGEHVDIIANKSPMIERVIT